MFKIEIKGLREVSEMLDPKKFKKVITRTLNKTADQARTAASKKIRGEYNIKAGRIKEGISTTRATQMRPEVIIRVRGRTPGLQHYDAKQTRKGVTVKVKGTRKTVQGGFMPKVIIGVYKRTGGSPIRMTKGRYKGQMREPIKRLYGPALPSMMKIVGVPAIEKIVSEKMEKVFNHEFEWELSKK